MTRQQLDALEAKFSDTPVAVYVPACHGAFLWPEQDVPFTAPVALGVAADIRAANDDDPDAAIILVYGIPWTP